MLQSEMTRISQGVTCTVVLHVVGSEVTLVHCCSSSYNDIRATVFGA
jgi:hypothetical protein